MTRRRSLCLLTAITLVIVAAPRPSAKVTPSGSTTNGVGAAETTLSLRTGAPSQKAGTESWPAQAGSTPATVTAPHPTGGIGEPASYQKPTPKPRGGGIAGLASWYDDGPGLYVALPGGDFRGHNAVICGGRPFTCLTVPVRTSCICTGPPPKVADLSPDLFRQFAPLSRGIVKVTVTTRETHCD